MNIYQSLVILSLLTLLAVLAWFGQCWLNPENVVYTQNKRLSFDLSSNLTL